MSLVTGDSRAKPKCNRKRNPSYLRRQRRRREVFLQKRDMTGVNLVGGGLAETVENIQDGEGNGEAGERTLEEDEPQEEQELTLKDIHDLLSEHLSLRRCIPI